jgi:hypothetical protein
VPETAFCGSTGDVVFVYPIANRGWNETPEFPNAYAGDLAANDHPLESPGMNSEKPRDLIAIE